MIDWKETIFFKKLKFCFLIGSKVILLLGFFILIYAATIYILKNISLEISSSILDYLRVTIWPMIALIGIFVFRVNLSNLLERGEEFEMPGGFRVKTSRQNFLSQQATNTSEEVVVGGSDVDSLPLEKVIETKEVEIGTLQNTQQQLIDKLARAETELDFERIYNVIFSSQIELLAKLAVLNVVDFSYIEEHYSVVRQSNRKVFKEWTVTQYMQFLLRTQLVDLSESMAISITPKGRAFVSYLALMNYRKYGM